MLFTAGCSAKWSPNRARPGCQHLGCPVPHHGQLRAARGLVAAAGGARPACKCWPSVCRVIGALSPLQALGELRFEYLMNDGQPNHNRWLIDLKNIFSRQLPNMPKEYIARLVMDRRHRWDSPLAPSVCPARSRVSHPAADPNPHRSVAIVKRSGQCVGGITYRAFHAQGFGEIAFCAITATEQVKVRGPPPPPQPVAPRPHCPLP